MTPSPLLTIRQASERSGIHRRTLLRWCKARLHIEPGLLTKLSDGETAPWRVNPDALGRLLGQDIEGLSDRVHDQGRRTARLEQKVARLMGEVGALRREVGQILRA